MLKYLKCFISLLAHSSLYSWQSYSLTTRPQKITTPNINKLEEIEICSSYLHISSYILYLVLGKLLNSVNKTIDKNVKR